jgi:hypothetical protein
VEPLNKGNSVSLSADGTTIVGGPGDSNGQGAAWVYAPSGSVWTQQGSKLVSTVASGAAQQGSSVAVSSGGNTAIAIVGGPGDSNGQGAAWVYRRTPGLFWMEGPKLVGTGASAAAQQGSSVSLFSDGNTAIVGGPGDTSGQGAAWVYRHSGGGGGGGPGSWTPLGKLGGTAIVGGLDDNGGAGAAWVLCDRLRQHRR